MAVGTARKIIRAARLIDGTGAEPQTDVAIVIQGTRIASIEPWREELRAGATVYEYPVETVVPGLVDAHCHLSLLGAGLRYEEEIPHSNEFMAGAGGYKTPGGVKNRGGAPPGQRAPPRHMFWGPAAREPGGPGGPPPLVSGG